MKWFKSAEQKPKLGDDILVYLGKTNGIMQIRDVNKNDIEASEYAYDYWCYTEYPPIYD